MEKADAVHSQRAPLVAGEGAGRENSGPVMTSTGQADAWGGGGGSMGLLPGFGWKKNVKGELRSSPGEQTEGASTGSPACPADLTTFTQQDCQQLLGFCCDLRKRRCAFLKATLELHPDVISHKKVQVSKRSIQAS